MAHKPVLLLLLLLLVVAAAAALPVACLKADGITPYATTLTFQP